MVELNGRILNEAAERGNSLLVDDFVRFVEQYHPDGQPGVARETLDAYVEGLGNERPGFDPTGFHDAIESRLTDDEGYTTDAFYRLGGDRVSVYPPSWHDELDGETDLVKYVRFLSEGDTGAEGGAELGGAGRGVPENELLELVGVLGGTDPQAAKAELEALRGRGELVERADQHPNARVQLPENAENARDSSVDP